jgi:IS1 family transposase
LKEKQIFYTLWKSIKESEVTEEMKDKWVAMGFENWKFIS